MEKEMDLAKIYELIEQFDFEELPENQKSFVLEHISHKEYTDMRSTLRDTKDLFSKHPDSGKKGHSLPRKKFIAHPIELYKVAAVVILFFGIGYSVSQFISFNQNEFIAEADTVYIKKTDTVLIEKVRIIKVVQDRIVYKDKMITESPILQQDDRIENASVRTDCSKNLCPEDMVMLSKTKTKGDFSTDTMLTEFMIDLN